MRNETVRKATEKRPGKTLPTEGGAPSKKVTANIGAITKGSSGRPKGDTGKSQNGTGSTHRTKANQTTSTSFPKKPVPQSFLNKLGEMHTGEKELTHALPLMVKAAKSKDLKTLLQVHLKETRGHLKALEQVATSLGEKLPDRDCKPITQLIKEGVKVIAKRLVSADQDAALIAVGQKIERFEIDAYTPLCATAKASEWTHERALLSSILVQETMAEELLGALAAGKGPLNRLVEQASLKHGTSPAIG